MIRIYIFKNVHYNEIYFLGRLRGTDLHVTVDVRFKCMLGNKSKVLRVEVMPDVMEPTFKKDGDNIIYAIPPSVAIIDNGTSTRLDIRTAS